MAVAPREPQVLAVVPAWIEAHCVIPDGFRKGDAFRLYDYQLEYVANFYLVRGDVEFDDVNPIKAPAFVHRRGLLVGPQKLGKGPFAAAHICGEAVGPALFAGWAGADDGYACEDHGCGCGWEYAYDRGEPMGMSWPTPLIQITAFSDDQTDNIYDALRPMIEDGPLADLIPKTGEDFIRLPGGGRIDTVTSSAQSRLGNPVTFVKQDEVGIWTPANKMTKVADAQYRNLAGMGGRASLMSNAWDPQEKSVAQQQYESKSKDIYRQFVQPPKSLSYRNKAERRKIHRVVYPKDVLRQNGGHIDLDSIESEAIDLMARDLAQAERFFGNRVTAGSGTAFDAERWKALARPKLVTPDGALVVVGVDGARFRDSLAVIGTDVASGRQWKIGVWSRPEKAPPSYEHPFEEVDQAMVETFGQFEVWRVYIDPQWIELLVDRWLGRWGDRIFQWHTNRPKQAAYMVRNYTEAIAAGDVTNDGDEEFAAHIANARKRMLNIYDEDRRQMHTLAKEYPMSPASIDAAMAGGLSWEARGDAIAAGADREERAPAIW